MLCDFPVFVYCAQGMVCLRFLVWVPECGEVALSHVPADVLPRLPTVDAAASTGTGPGAMVTSFLAVCTRSGLALSIGLSRLLDACLLVLFLLSLALHDWR